LPEVFSFGQPGSK